MSLAAELETRFRRVRYMAARGVTVNSIRKSHRDHERNEVD